MAICPKRTKLIFAVTALKKDADEKSSPPKRRMSLAVFWGGAMETIMETIIGRGIVDESDTIVDLQAYAREKWRKQMI